MNQMSDTYAKRYYIVLISQIYLLSKDGMKAEFATDDLNIAIKL